MSGLQGDLFDGLQDEPEQRLDAATALAAAPMDIDRSAADAAHVIGELNRWSERGWIRRLDAAFGRFVAELDPEAPSTLLMAASMVAHMEGRGHACLKVGEFCTSFQSVAAWRPEAAEALASLMARLSAEPDVWRQALSSSRVVSASGAESADQATPLVFDGDKLYLRRYWNYESRVAHQVTRRVAIIDEQAAATVARTEAEPVDAAHVRSVLDRLFGSAEHAGTAMVIDWQRVACAVALRARLSIITGGPGTGKTYTVARLLALLFAMAPDAKRLRVALAAPTGKAAARLKQSIDSALGELGSRVDTDLPVRDLAQHIGPARTLHSLLGARGDTRHFQRNAANPLDIDVLVVDEASMVHLEMMDALLAALPVHARVIFLGDKDQLASVEAGAVLGDLCSDADAGAYDAATRAYVEATTGQSIPESYHLDERARSSSLAQQTVMLRVSRRFGGAIGELAKAVNLGDASAARDAFAADGKASPLQWIESASNADIVRIAAFGRPGYEGGYRPYLELVERGPASGQHESWVREVLAAFDRFRILCAVREGDWGVRALNASVEGALIDAGLLAKPGEWYEGRPVLVTRNDYAAGVFNGDVGIALRPSNGRDNLRVWFPDGAVLRSVMASRLADVETAFAMTVHKSQGSEFDHTVLALPEDAGRVASRELVYTGITRARSAFTLVTPVSDVFNLALAQRTMRASGLPQQLEAEEARRHRP